MIAATTAQGIQPVNYDVDHDHYVEVGRLTSPRTGYGHVSAMYVVSRANGNYVSSAWVQLRLHLHNYTVVYGPLTGVPNGGDDRDTTAMVHWTGNIGAGQIVALEVAGRSGNGNYVRLSSGNLSMTVGTNW